MSDNSDKDKIIFLQSKKIGEQAIFISALEQEIELLRFEIKERITIQNMVEI